MGTQGLVMRVLTERLKGRELDLTDGIKAIDDRGWAEVLPDPDEPLITSTPWARPRRPRGARSRDCASSSRTSCRGRNPGSRRQSQVEVEPSVPACFNGDAGAVDRREVMEAFPDLAGLSDGELKALIKQLEEERTRSPISGRLLHGKLDILRAELVARLKKKGEGELGQIDIDRLSEILAGKAPPPAA